MPKTIKQKSNHEQQASQMPAQPTQPQPQTQPNFVQAPDFKSIYTNFVNAAFSPLDIFLILGEAMGVGPDGKPTVLQRAKVIMSPVEAKIVAAIFAQTVANFEKQYGKIEVAKEFMPQPLEGV